MTDANQTVKYLVIAVLAAGCGFLAFNIHHIARLTHAHIPLAHHHRYRAFCAFAGCKYTEDLQDTFKPAVEVTDEPKASTPSVDAEQLQNVTHMLSTRVCGSPAVDGYAHVDPKCLEESPTAKWWKEYYAKGGKQQDLMVYIEKAADYDGLAVVWGIDNKKTTAEECAAHCRRHMPGQVQGPYSNLPCNAFAWCPDDVCFEPDAHHHTKGDCWLKFTEGPVSPELNMRGDLPDDYRVRHANAPKTVQWWSGVLLPPGVKPTNGTWGPRWKW